MTETVSITLWATNLGRVLSGPEEWLASVETVAREAKEAGSALLVAPEYVSELWLTYAGPSLTSPEEPACMAEAGSVLCDGLQAIADQVGIDIMAGSWPVADGRGGFNNTAHLFLAGGDAPIIQKKLCMTPAEKNPALWGMRPHDSLRIFEWNGLRCAILICLDIELPALSVRLAKDVPDLDLILCPSMTEKPSGYNRVFGCAKARAVELMTTVAVVGVIGDTPLGAPRPNVSGAAVYMPCEAELGFDGRFAEIGPFSEAQEGDAPESDVLGPRLHARDIPVGIVRSLRRSQPEVWPGAWSDAALSIEDPSAGAEEPIPRIA